MKVTRINEHNFNADWAQSVSEKQFVDTLLPVPFWKDAPDKEAKLHMAWRLMNGKHEEEIAAVDEAPEPVPAKKPTSRKRATK